MLENNFFTIIAEKSNENQVCFTVRINAEHPIFGGHFPGDPITPGVCIVQMACDLFSHLQQQKFVVFSLKNAKFMQIIRPLETPEVNFQISYQLTENQNDFDVKCVVSNPDTTFAKFSFTVSPTSLKV